jgi:hypothetical protein
VLLAYLFYGIGSPVVALFHSFQTYCRPEFTAGIVREWLGRLGGRTLFIERGSPWDNGNEEPFIDKFRDELVSGEDFDTVLLPSVVSKACRREYNHHRHHSSLGYKPQELEARMLETFTLEVVSGKGRLFGLGRDRGPGLLLPTERPYP